MSASESATPAPFFLVGDALCLDLLNTVAAGHDLLPDFASYLGWLARVGVEVGADTPARETRAALARVKELRESLRGAVCAFAAGEPVPDETVASLNALLARSPVRTELTRGSGEAANRLQKRFRVDWKTASDLLAPVAESAADLFCNADPALVRRCDGAGCTLMFLDRTKNHRRRWCSMAACGNRAKVAAHRARRKGQSAS